MYLLMLLNFVLIVSGVWSNNLISPCKKSDLVCLEKSINAALPKILDGIPELGVESSDPNYVDLIEGDITIFKYKFTNTSFIGFKTCNITNLKFDEDMTTLSCNVNCPSIIMSGQYDIKGELLSMSLDGKGDYEFTTGYYLINLNAELEMVKGSDEKKHLYVKNLQLKPKPLSENKLKFRNFNHGGKYHQDVDELVKKHWLEITLLLQQPVWSNSFNEVAKHVNKYLESVAIDDIWL